MRILLGISGGIAAYKTPELVRLLQKRGHSVAAALTPAAQQFVSPTVLRTLCDHSVMTDIFAGEPGAVEHIELADWAEVMVVAPATAQTLARLASGAADEPVSLSFLATRARKLVCPAMNVNMWQAAPVQRNVAQLRADGAVVLEPEAGELACGWVGAGRLPELETIAAAVESLRPDGPWRGRRVLITAGPTREFIDPARFLSNPSTGKMGFALAEAAAALGAEVVLVAGPTSLPTPHGVQRVDVISAADMLAACIQACEQKVPDVVIGAAAVADFTPAEPCRHKRKKDQMLDALPLKRTEDVLATIVTRYRPRIKVGFAAESKDVLAYAKAKLERKGLDLVVANNITEPGAGFAADTNRVWLVSADAEPQALPAADKKEVARRILAHHLFQ